MQDQSTEVARVEYRPIEGYPGYRAGSDGTIWSHWGKGSSNREGKQGKKWISLAFRTDRDKRLRVNLYRGGKMVKLYVHHVIIRAFLGNRPDGKECCHNDGNPANNRLDNLRWDTRESNMADKVLHGTHNRGERCGTSKLKEEDVIEARKLYASGEWTFKKLGGKFGVTSYTMRAAIRRITWQHVAA